MSSMSALASQMPASHAAAAQRVRFITHAGQNVLLIDYSNCDVTMLKLVVEEGHRVIARELPNSVITLNDGTGTSFDGESVTSFSVSTELGNSRAITRCPSSTTSFN